MIRKIAPSDLEIGMYVHDLNCSWLDHPFAVSQFELTTEEEIRKIQGIGISFLYIDTEKGAASAGLETRSAEPEASQLGTSDVPMAGEMSMEDDIPAVALEQEITHAVRIKKEAVQLVSGIMEDVDKGYPVNLERITPVVDEMVSSVLRNRDALLGLSRIRQVDQYTFEHMVGVSALLITLGNHLGLDREELVGVGIGGLLMDVGKAMIPSYILNKPAKLTEKETKVVARHVMHSQKVVKKTPGVSSATKELVMDHHERIDGSGYPEGKRSDDISFYGKMAAIVDVYDALSSDRVYKKGVSPHAALKELMELGGVGFENDLVQRFVQCMGIYPLGTLVSLSNGHLAVVIEASRKGLLSPKVKVIFDTIKRYYVEPEIRDLSSEGETTKIVGVVQAGKWGINPDEFMSHA